MKATAATPKAHGSTEVGSPSTFQGIHPNTQLLCHFLQLFSATLLSTLWTQPHFPSQIVYSSYDTPFRHPPLNQIGHGTVHPHDFRLELSWWEQQANKKLQLPGTAQEGASDSWGLQSLPALLHFHQEGHWCCLDCSVCFHVSEITAYSELQQTHTQMCLWSPAPGEGLAVRHFQRTG